MYDLVVIGGGINGVGIAQDASCRGLKVLLLEKGDLACATSSWSSKLIHGGLRYLEQYDFRLVRKALKERDVLLNMAPFLIKPLRFVMPHHKSHRPFWMLRLGIWLYDHLYRSSCLSKSCAFRLSGRQRYGLKPHYHKALSYFDAQVADARLVALTAKTAQSLGADIYTRHCVEQVTWQDDHWQVCARHGKQTKKFQARAIVNATGPWVTDVMRDLFDEKQAVQISHVKGSHLIVPRCVKEDAALILQSHDNRVVFVIPYEDNFSLIGTTDVSYQGDLDQPKITDEEVNYLLKVVNEYLEKPVSHDDIVHTYAGVRPLFSKGQSDPSQISRDYHFEMKQMPGPVVHVCGGKLTTYRQLSEECVDLLASVFPHMSAARTSELRLWGAKDLGVPIDQFKKDMMAHYASLPARLIERLVRDYGTHVRDILQNIQSIDQLGQHFGGSLYQVEVDYLVQHEWAQTVEDILWRRTQQGLYVDGSKKKLLEDYIKSVS